jgi:heme-degrading monooxygenase HmoA
MIAQTPQPPYYAVVFTSVRSAGDTGYSEMAERMVELAKKQPGFLGVESARDEVGITVSYWKDLDSIKKWREHPDHQVAIEKGKKMWYESYKVRIAKVERDYEL